MDQMSLLHLDGVLFVPSTMGRPAARGIEHW
jgi:hypothetical protein